MKPEVMSLPFANQSIYQIGLRWFHIGMSTQCSPYMTRFFTTICLKESRSHLIKHVLQLLASYCSQYVPRSGLLLGRLN